MTITEGLAPASRIFLDSAPVIYFVERHPRYEALVNTVFNGIDAGTYTAVTSPVTLAECLVVPMRKGQTDLQQDFRDLVVDGQGVVFWSLNDSLADSAAKLRSVYKIALPDAFQVAVAIASGCDAFLTNDLALKRVQEITILVLDELDSPETP